MINHLSGTVQHVDSFNNKIVVEIAGCGIALQTPRPDAFIRNEHATVFTYLHWNAEHGPSLFGFPSELDRTAFLLIIECSKIGPQIALSILSQCNASEFLEIITAQNEKALSAVKGIGEKKAEAIILQLKHKVSKLISSGQLKPTQSSNFTHWQTLSDALTSLGYSKQEVNKALQHVGAHTNQKSVEFNQLMRVALAYLSTDQR